MKEQKQETSVIPLREKFAIEAVIRRAKREHRTMSSALAVIVYEWVLLKTREKVRIAAARRAESLPKEDQDSGGGVNIQQENPAASLLPYEDSAKLLSMAQEEHGKPGQLPSQGQVDMVSVVGDFMNRRNLDVATGGKLLKILHAAGVQDSQQAALRLQQLSDVQGESQIDSLSEFIKGASEVADPLARQGRSFENILASYAFEAEADAIEKENKSIGRDDPKAKVKYRAKMEGRKQYLEQIAQSSDPDRFMRQSMDYRNTLPGAMDSGAAGTEAIGSSASDELMLGREAMKKADEKFKVLSEEGKTNPYITDEYEKRILTWQDLHQRAQDQGNQGAIDYLNTRRPIPMLGTPSIGDVGKVEKMLQSPQATAPGPVTINNDYSRRTYQMPIVGHDSFRDRYSNDYA